MKHLLLGFVIVTFCAAPICAKEDGEYWVKIKELLKQDTPRGNPELEKYLKSLTKEQLLTTLRQYCSWIEKQPLNRREWAEVLSMRILSCYAEPLKRSDISDEEFRKMGWGKQQELEIGFIPARFLDSAFDKWIAGIADQKGGDYFRWTLAVLFSDDEYFFPVLSKAQRERYFDTCLTVATDRESPDMVRAGCMKVLAEIFTTKYRKAIFYEDDAVKELRRTNTDSQLRELIRSGKVDFTAKTIRELAIWRPKIHDLRKRLTDVLKDDREPELVKKEAKRCLSWLDRLPLIDANTPVPQLPKN